MGKKTTEEFIREAKKAHGDKYDYSSTEYNGNKIKVKIGCPIHGEFEQTPDSHLRGAGCPKCSGNAKKTTEDFIKEAKAVHGDRYDYSSTEYNGNKTKVKIGCPIHGEFEQTPSKHLSGCGCPKCSGNAKKTTEDFIKEAKAVHGDRYDYSLVNYVNIETTVKIICPKHGVFEQKPNAHLSGSGCPKCIGRNKTTKDFIKEAKAIHGDRYDYSSTEYNGNKTKVKIGCPIHGEFEQTPSKHLSGCGCPKCSGNAKKTTEDFIKEAKAVHGDRYDYSSTEYINATTKVKIGCKIHGEFEQTPDNHLHGNGCPKCGGTVKKATDEFIKDAIAVHGDKYNYSSTEYKNAKTKVKIGCIEHGEFEQTPNKHLQGKGCPKCIGRNKTTEEFIKEAKKVHGDKYNYSSTEYNGSMIKVKIGCPIHGEFEQNPNSHLYGKGCPKCIGRNKTTDDFIIEAKAVHGDKYDYSLVEYIDAKTKVKIGCPVHGIFEQNPSNHLNGQGCPICNNSKGEIIISNYLSINKIDFITQYKFKECKNIRSLPFDFYLPKYNMCIEFDGKQHFESIEKFGGEEALLKNMERDNIKNKYCIDNNIKLLRIRYDQIDNIENILNKNIVICIYIQ